MKNFSVLINNKSDRTLSAKGNKFLNQCVLILANSKGLTRYHSEFKSTKEKITVLIKDLIIDKEMNIYEIKELIKSTRFLN